MVISDIVGRYLNDCVSGSLGDDSRLVISDRGMVINRRWRHDDGYSDGVNELIWEERMCAWRR